MESLFVNWKIQNEFCVLALWLVRPRAVRVLDCINRQHRRCVHSPNIRPARHIVAANSNPYMSNPRLLHRMYICMVRRMVRGFCRLGRSLADGMMMEIVVLASSSSLSSLLSLVLLLGTDWRWTRVALTTGRTTG